MMRHCDQVSQGADYVADLAQGNRKGLAASVRPTLQALARVILTDRRAVALANQKGEILLANLAAQRLNIQKTQLVKRFNWSELCTRTRRAGSISASWQAGNHTFDGEVVHVPLGPAEGFLLRLSESDQESIWLRNRARSATLMRVAHDLRTPIQSLLASADSLTKQSERAEQSKGNAEVRRAAELALEHISNVLGVLRGEQNLTGGQPDEDFRIAEELANLIALVQPIANARASEVSLTVDAPEDLTLRGPVQFVRALCQNLIDNSVNHGGGRVDLYLHCAPLNIPVTAEDTEGDIWHIKLKLIDEGGGLPVAQRVRLSEALGLPMGDHTPRLVELDNRPSAGLNVLAHALRQLGGRITIENRGRDGTPLQQGCDGSVVGTIFTITFSLPRAATQSIPVAELLQNASKTPLTGRTILLVEDSPSSRDWLTYILQAAGAEVIPAGSGPEALALLSRQEYGTRVDMMLTDVTLPRMNGITLASRIIAGDPASASAWTGKIVGLTAHADDRVRAACLKAGMVHVLEKPIKPEKLSRILADILDGTSHKESVINFAAPATAAINAIVAADLIEHIGIERTQGFMRSALFEAKSILDDLFCEGAEQDTGRRLHAATGASGLTGLQLIEKRLREIELSVNSIGSVPTSLCDALAEALDETYQKIEDLAELSLSVS